MARVCQEVQVVCKALTTFYTGGNWQGIKKCDDSALDAAIIDADLAMNMNVNNEMTIGESLVTVGQQLEALKNYSQACRELYSA